MTMVARLLEMVTDYEKRLRTMQHVPGFSYGSPMLRDDGCPNKFFFMYLFWRQNYPEVNYSPNRISGGECF